ncbi:type VI secretion system baseplate subunit TssF [Nitrogeniibacter mangrovi]|uniref:Type VI secretion system baseplate subunit TssF n=1 Tax=Nitrogeniibacter mangrovi TaxID=2016596 RepID=A0A6C1B5E9_9RHOO|nr:type VI secretion system baseplate subunit TssF [Nitrogeniibacter mangrovi]QID17454.1 type VI secretion system baseplate subunit TssF [Nitrogeniibacter mangrovi]
MEDLLPFYERELAFLRRHSREFAERYPKIAAQLLLTGEGCDDPHVERMIESFALLNARVSKKIEDGYPQFTEALLGVLYPHYLRPFPSCSIAHFDTEGADLQMSSAVTLGRGALLNSRAMGGATCRFRTIWDLELPPVRIENVSFDPLAQAPAQVRLPVTVTAVLTVRLRLPGAEGGWSRHGPGRLRCYIDAEASVAAALRDSLFLRLVGVWASSEDERWHPASRELVRPVGFADDEAIIEMPSSSHAAYRHLTEYFAFPEKFNFFDLEIGRVPTAARQGSVLNLHLAFSGLRAEGDASRLLQGLGKDGIRLGCVPVVNLFEQRGEPIRVTHRKATYPVLADARRAHAYEVYSIESVRRVRQTPQGETITEFRPFFSLRHGEVPEEDGHYWHAERNALVAERSPGHELELTLVDADFDPLAEQSDTLSLKLMCTNRDLPTRMSIGMPSGDLFLDGGSIARRIRLLRKPTAPLRFDHRRGGLWRLVSHLALNHLSLTRSGLAAFKEMLALYDLPRTAVSRRQIDGIVAIDHACKTAWLPGAPFASFVRGLEVTLTVDEASFVGTGLHVFAQVLDRFLGLYVHLNSFIQLVLVSSRTGEELIRCEPRTGDSILG